MHFAQALGKSSSLKSLNLSRNKIGEQKGGFILKELSLCLTLEVLDLSENNIEDTIGKYFFKLIAETNLRSLNLSNNRIRNQTMESIQAAMVHNKQFCEL